MNFIIKRINRNACADINLPNQPFPLCGKIHLIYNGAWHHTVEMFPPEQQSEMVFPDENYSYDEMKENSVFVGAYTEEGICIGLAIYRHSWNRYLYLYDLKVNAAFRRQGVGKLLISEGKRVAAEQGYRGIYTQGQDNNLNACLFYLHTGFVIGGLDTMVYEGTRQAGKSDVLFYLEV